jgi:hypothetical protein
MRKNRVLLLVCLFSLLSPRLFADIAAIHANALPQETAVLSALDDAKQLEPYSRSWTMNWEYPVTKDEVATRLSKDLGFLMLASKNHPDNAELLLLTGLVARYAYNLDVDGSFDAAMNALNQAQKLAPADFRAGWFRATLECQTTQPKAGGNEFLSIDSSRTWDQLPVEFWDDYLECALLTGMPAHALRAADHLEKLHAPASEKRASLVEIARKRFDPYNAKKDYQPQDVWQAEDTSDDTVFTSTLCGVRLRVHGNWQAARLDFANGSCVALFTTGPYQATTRAMHPSVMLLVQQPKGNESLEAYSKKFQTHGAFESFAPQCPLQPCIAFKGVQPGVYKGDGDGRPRLVFFERNEPEFPGLIFESPLELPKPDGTGGAKAYHPLQIQQRIPGKLYYLVTLDTASSIEEPALKDFDFFLQNLTVE